MKKVHIWCPRVSDSAIAIRNSLRAKDIKAYKIPARPTQKELNWFIKRIQAGDIWLNWGSDGRRQFGNNIPITTTLNSNTFYNKKTQLELLADAGVPVPKVFDEPGPERIGRSFRHVGGRDLLNNSGHDYYTERLVFDREVRVHVWKGLAIHTGLKVQRVGVEVHPWIRTYDAGWWIDYSKADTIRDSRRTLAKQAVKALGLDFGAVDIGVISGNNMRVLEVNTAPGLDEGPSVEVYVTQILKEVG